MYFKAQLMVIFIEWWHQPSVRLIGLTWDIMALFVLYAAIIAIYNGYNPAL